ncbi:MAG: phosphoadenylyl-sulfate reductase, partial [Candidatus Zixiibacteriota bacterium]
EDVVLIDMVARISPQIPVFTLDTGRLPDATYEVMEKISEKYGLNIRPYYPLTEAVENLVAEHGPNLFYKSVGLRKLCCSVRKIEPLQRALEDLSAWICGLRRQQSVTRTQAKKVEKDGADDSIIKINPLADWTESQIWAYIKENEVPYNRLHDENYPSIGCQPCTRAVLPGEDIRAGRWWWENPETKECGLHAKEEK